MSGKPGGPEEGTDPPGPLGDAHTATFVRRSGDDLSPPDEADPDLPLLLPDELLAGRFSIIRFIARGGMGAVYEAADASLRTRVALKIIRSSLLADSSALERFRREVLLARRVGHPNVCHVYEFYDARTASGVPVHFLSMELLEGQTLSSRLRERGRLSPEEALPLVLQMSDGLGAAHAEGVVHRDFKSGNVLLVRRHAPGGGTESTRVVITDFGIARPLESAPGDAALTGGAGVVGTPDYMAPEQVTGGAITPATDVYALGVVMYEMVTGALPFSGETPLAVAAKRIHEEPPAPETVLPGLDRRWSAVIRRCLAREPTRRFQSVQDVRAALLSRPRLPAGKLGALAVAGLLLVATAAWLAGAFGTRKDERWLRSEILPEIHRLADSDRPMAAHLLAQQANAVLPGNPELVAAWKSFANPVPISSTPPGARVLWREYDDTTGPWRELGVTPLKDTWFPRDGFYRFRLELDSYRPYEGAVSYWWLREDVPFVLDRVGSLPDDLVHVPGSSSTATPSDPSGTALGDFFLDRTEVTNRRYKAFVDAGGYGRRELWPPFVKGGTAVSWETAMAGFTDRTGRPGPSTWELSSYPRGEEDFPVGGISWYEASAFAAFEKRSLPTTQHWYRAAGTLGARWMIAASNFGSKGPVPVGRGGLNRFGTVDMAGNVREWCVNEEVGGTGGHFILGGGWNDPSYAFVDGDVQSPWDRSATNGARLATYGSADPGVEAARKPIARAFRDFHKEKPASDAEYGIYLRMYAYDRKPLNARVEQTETTDEWVREKVSFDAAYGNERMIAYLFVPKHGAPPFQPVVYFPGSNVIFQRSIDQELLSWDFLIRGGRMLVYPVFSGTLERRSKDLVSDSPDASMAYRDFVIRWARDLGRTIDYLETRKDVDASRIGYFGWSWGGLMGGLMPAVEPRIKAAVLHVAGLAFERPAPEVDPFNFLPHIKIPVLMLNGKLDHFFPVETSQVPMFEAFGTPPANKRQVIYEAGHLVPRSQLIKESLDWYDRYLGPVTAAAPAASLPAKK